MLVGNGQAVIVGIVILISREGWNTGVTLLTPENLFTGFTGIAALAVVLQATSGIIAAGVLRYVDNIADLFAHAGAMFITVRQRGEKGRLNELFFAGCGDRAID